MNNTFSFKRFAMLFKKHTLEHAKMYLMSAGVLAGVLFLILGFVAYTTGGQLPPGAQTVIFILFLLFAGSIFTSLSFAALGDKRKAIPVLTLPASHFEKYLVVWVYSFIIFQLVFVGVFYLADGIVLSLCSSATNHVQVLNLFDERYDSYAAFIIYMVLHAFAFLGAVYFEKLHFIKTSFVFFAFMIAFVFLNQPILNLMVDKEVLKSMPFEGLRFMENGHQQNIEPKINFDYYHLAAVCVTALLLWCSAFFRLKEKEV
jgi:hypothetical protein